MKPFRIAIVGYGKIAEDEHVPSIANNPRFELAAIVGSRAPQGGGVPGFRRHREMLEAVRDLDAVAICTPPSVRYDIARDCIERGLHCLLEKPPATTLSEIEDLRLQAEGRQATLFATWHSQYNPAVERAAELLAGKRIARMRIDWRESVRKWHPGQQWIWEVGGFGVFDPGINALSIASRIFPGPLFVREAELSVPENRAMPIAASIGFSSPVADGEVSAGFDWREEKDEIWTIEVETADGLRLRLSGGGARLDVEGGESAEAVRDEYPRIYGKFASLLDERSSLVDVAPLRLTADAFLVGRRVSVEPFSE
ncbi:MAG TPA: Gfo/Idh/MocA family oxidoreductase [Allosphingosinicella sp.]|jgi:predicted dehydrogenase